MKRKKRPELSNDIDESRNIRIPRNRDFEAPQLVKSTPINDKDLAMIQSLHSGLMKAGAIEDDTEEVGFEAYSDFEDQSLEEIQELISEANSVAKYEKDFHEEYYDEELDSYMDALSARTDEVDSELFDGKDDNGEQVFEDVRGRVLQRKKGIPVGVQDGSEVTFTMPNGTTVRGSIVQPMNDD